MLHTVIYVGICTNLSKYKVHQNKKKVLTYFQCSCASLIKPVILFLREKNVYTHYTKIIHNAIKAQQNEDEKYLFDLTALKS